MGRAEFVSHTVVQYDTGSKADLAFPRLRQTSAFVRLQLTAPWCGVLGALDPDHSVQYHPK